MSITYGILAIAFAVLGILDIMNNSVITGVMVLFGALVIGTTAVVVAVFHKKYPTTRPSTRRSIS
jgi:hypothetical protein